MTGYSVATNQQKPSVHKIYPRIPITLVYSNTTILLENRKFICSVEQRKLLKSSLILTVKKNNTKQDVKEFQEKNNRKPENT